jgi:hypothetical protein
LIGNERACHNPSPKIYSFHPLKDKQLQRLNGPLEISTPHSRPAPAHCLIRGRDNILRHSDLLESLCELSNQKGELDTLHHFLTTSVALRKVPCLALLAATDDEAPAIAGYSGAVLFFEYRLLGKGLRLYATSDWTGRRNVLGPAALRPRFAATACRMLIDNGAHIVFVAYHAPDRGPLSPELASLLRGTTRKGQWSVLRRDVALYLPLKSTFDDTLARIGQKTRANLRYYRRRTEATFGCKWVPHVTMTEKQFVDFNRRCSFPVGDTVARERYAGMKTHKRPFLSGLCAEDGQWLALVMGWYRHNAVEVEWQMNRSDLPEYSLSTVLRSFLIEYAIQQGFERLYIEGGTQQSLQNAFVVEDVHDLTVITGSLYSRSIRRYAHRVFPEDNRLSCLLQEHTLEWQNC